MLTRSLATLYGEKHDWMKHLTAIPEHNSDRPLDPFDRGAQFRDGVGKNLSELLDEFPTLRGENLARLR